MKLSSIVSSKIEGRALLRLSGPMLDCPAVVNRSPSLPRIVVGSPSTVQPAKCRHGPIIAGFPEYVQLATGLDLRSEGTEG
jgi:hypothetical protein